MIDRHARTLVHPFLSLNFFYEHFEESGVHIAQLEVDVHNFPEREFKTLLAAMLTNESGRMAVPMMRRLPVAASSEVEVEQSVVVAFSAVVDDQSHTPPFPFEMLCCSF